MGDYFWSDSAVDEGARDGSDLGRLRMLESEGASAAILPGLTPRL